MRHSFLRQLRVIDMGISSCGKLPAADQKMERRRRHQNFHFGGISKYFLWRVLSNTLGLEQER